jgi:folate-dependent tRNA-U54 methylase TrmFO/GidA
MNAYATGLNGEEAAWAIKKYKGHRVLPIRLIEIIDQRRTDSLRMAVSPQN